MYELGDVVTLDLTVRDPLTELPADATSVGLTITRPDLTTVAPVITHVPGTGFYTVNFEPDDVGLHRIRWVATGVNAGAFDDQFTVEDDYTPFVSLSEQLQHMGATDVITEPADLETLRYYIRVACEAVELDLGRKISPQTVTQTFDGGCSALVLSGTPVLSISSLMEAGVPVLSTGYVLDPTIGILYRGTSTTPRRFTSGRQNITVTYRAGQTRPSAVARKVARNGAQRMWQSGQMPHPNMDDLGAEQAARAGILTPLELAAYWRLKAPGLA